MRVLMVAAENGALPGGKVGGMADVVEQVPTALVAAGIAVDVIVPSYGVYQQRPDASLIARVDVKFAGTLQSVDLYRLTSFDRGVNQWVLHHPLFGDPPGRIYHHDPDHQPFATDANLYALFSLAVTRCIDVNCWPELEVVHLHDWHTSGVLLFLTDSPRLRTVFTIHNLALQGQRPLSGHPSSFSAWFGDLPCPADAIDPRYPDCYNPMRLGINRADRVHTVSPSYVQDIQQAPSGMNRGGEGLEADLQAAAKAGRLHGILNGCEYPADRPQLLSRPDVWKVIEENLAARMAAKETVSPADHFASRNLDRVRKLRRKPMLVTSVGRMVPQKIDLLRVKVEPEGVSTLEALLRSAAEQVVFVVLGTGDADCERFLIELSIRYPALIYLKGYDESAANALYDNGDLFLMPSLFEPCGISQMLAMRAGQPCLVHATGGLRDTVINDVDGFWFEGDSYAAAAAALVNRFRQLETAFQDSPESWKQIRSAARNKRFDWASSARGYVDHLYRA